MHLLKSIFHRQRYSDFKRDVSIKTNKPKNFEKMLDYARKLSNKFCFCRVDFYEVDNVLYLGEMTFSPTNVEMNFNNRSISLYKETNQFI